MPVNFVSMMDSWMNSSPTLIWPRACMTASRAEVPVPHGLRSMRPGETITAFRDVGRPCASRPMGPAHSVWLMVWISGLAGWTALICTAAAALICSPMSTSCRASSGLMEKPSAWASTST